MKRALLGLAIVAFVVAGAAQPAFAQQQQDQAQNDSEMEEPRQPENETEAEGMENETESSEQETGEEMNQSQGRSAQFDARLQVSIRTVNALIEIAPNEEARTGLENALDSLQRVQNNTATASLGPEDRPNRTEEVENESEDEEQDSEQRQGPPEDRGPSQNSNRPGFVNRMLSGIFG